MIVAVGVVLGRKIWSILVTRLEKNCFSNLVSACHRAGLLFNRFSKILTLSSFNHFATQKLARAILQRETLNGIDLGRKMWSNLVTLLWENFAKSSILAS
jgi:hypothetical protein